MSDSAQQNLPSDPSRDAFDKVLKKIVEKYECIRKNWIGFNNFFSVIRDCAEMLESLDEFLGNPNRNLSPKDEILKENFLSNGLKKLSDEWRWVKT